MASCVSGLSTSPLSSWRRVSTSCHTPAQALNLLLCNIFFGVCVCVEHEGPVSLVCVSSDGLSVLAATKTGNLGYLDVSSRAYRTLMRSHMDTVLGFSVDGTRHRITTASRDGTVRIWDVDSAQQVCFHLSSMYCSEPCIPRAVKMFTRLSLKLYDFVPDDHNDTPSSVAFHPRMPVFACGFSSGTVRVFDISTSSLLAQHRYPHTHAHAYCSIRMSLAGDFL